MSLIKIKSVSEQIGLARASIYLRLDKSSKYFDPTFPKAVKIGQRSVAWVQEEIDSWVESRISERNQQV